MRKGIVKYTAFIPKTIKAVKCIGSTFIKKVDCYLNQLIMRLKI